MRFRPTLATLVALLLCVRSVAGAQELASDAALLTSIAQRYPCPAVVPDAWRAADTTLASGVRCSLVAAAAAAIRAAPREVGISGFDPERVTCVRVVSFVFRDFHTGKPGVAYWSVEFYRPEEPWARAVIDRHSGAIDAVPLESEFGYSYAKMCAPAT